MDPRICNRSIESIYDLDARAKSWANETGATQMIPCKSKTPAEVTILASRSPMLNLNIEALDPALMSKDDQCLTPAANDPARAMKLALKHLAIRSFGGKLFWHTPMWCSIAQCAVYTILVRLSSVAIEVV